MTKLNQILAVEKGARNNGQRTLTGAYQLLQKSTLLAGITKAYRPRDEDGEQLPGESTIVQVRTERVIDDVAAAIGRMWDVTAIKDWTNCIAKADVVVDGQVLLADVPVTYLLYLEKQLVELGTFVRKLPHLDPAEPWVRDDATDTWRNGQGTQTARSKKVPRNHVKAAATDKHPAQVDIYFEDQVVGYWTTVKFSGALPAQRINELTARIAKLAEAVKMARESANSVEVAESPGVSGAIFGYLLR